MPRAFFETRNGEFQDTPLYIAWDGFQRRGYETVKFETAFLPDLPLEGAETVVCGRIPTVKRALRQLGKTPPDALVLPEYLNAFYHRVVTWSTMGEVRRIVGEYPEQLPLFIKPGRSQKLFNGCVVRGFRDLIPSSAVDDPAIVIVQQVVEFLSEWRVFVLGGKILNLSHYAGDPLLLPDILTIQRFLCDYAEDKPPCAFSADFGWISEEMALVEVNDSFALGCYGLNSVDYSRMIEARWIEMCKN